MIARYMVLAIALWTATSVSAQAFADVQGTWYLRKSWEDNTLIFDADSDLVYLSYAFSRAAFLSAGSTPQDSAAAMQRAQQRFRELKSCTMIIQPDGSYTTSDFDRGRVMKEKGAWVLIQADKPDGHIPVQVNKEFIEFTMPAKPLMRMQFSRRGH